MDAPLAADALSRLIPSMLVLGLVGGGLYVWGRRHRTGAVSGVRVLSRSPLAKNASALVVEVEGRRLLLGVTDQQVQLLTALDADVEAVPHSSEDGAEGSARRDDRLLAALSAASGVGTNGRPTTVNPGTGATASGLIERLQHLTVRRAVPPAAASLTRFTRDRRR